MSGELANLITKNVASFTQPKYPLYRIEYERTKIEPSGEDRIDFDVLIDTVAHSSIVQGLPMNRLSEDAYALPDMVNACEEQKLAWSTLCNQIAKKEGDTYPLTTLMCNEDSYVSIVVLMQHGLLPLKLIDLMYDASQRNGIRKHKHQSPHYISMSSFTTETDFLRIYNVQKLI